MGTYTLKEVKEIADLVVKYKLDGREILEKYLIEEISEIYNGAGPDSWIELAREVLTALMSLFKPVVMIHDMDFNESDGTEATFQVVTARWKANSKRIMNTEYPLWTLKQLSRDYRLKRAYWYGVMLLANEAISGDNARAAWQAAHNRKQITTDSPEKKGNAPV